MRCRRPVFARLPGSPSLVESGVIVLVLPVGGRLCYPLIPSLPQGMTALRPTKPYGGQIQRARHEHNLFFLNRATPALFVYLRHAGEHQLVFRDVARHGGACGDGRTFRDRHRRHQLGIGADKNIITNDGFVLVSAIIVTGDGACADVNVIADFRVAEVGQMTAFEPLPRRAFFISTKLPTCAPSRSSAPGRRRANGPMVQAVSRRASSTTL